MKISPKLKSAKSEKNPTFYNNGKMLENLHFAHFTNAENSENQTFPAVMIFMSLPMFHKFSHFLIAL